MTKPRTPRNLRRSLCGVPTDNHEIEPDVHYGVVLSHACRSCDFIGDESEGWAHIIAHQFKAERGDQ